MVARGTPCLGPVTQAGCGAICPAFGRGCYGCFGPMATPNVSSLVGWVRRLGMPDADINRGFRTFHVANPGFRAAAEQASPRQPGAGSAGGRAERVGTHPRGEVVDGRRDRRAEGLAIAE